jgi:hypothetical protein
VKVVSGVDVSGVCDKMVKIFYFMRRVQKVGAIIWKVSYRKLKVSWKSEVGGVIEDDDEDCVV